MDSAVLHQMEKLTGAVLVGTLLSFCGLGVVAHQATSYFARYPHDRAIFKIMATTCLVLCIIDTIVNGTWCYKWLITGYGDPLVLLIAPWEFGASLFIGGLTNMLVQCFYAWRIHKVSNDGVIVPCIVILCTLIQFGGVCLGFFQPARSPSRTNPFSELKTVYAIPVMGKHPSLTYLASAPFTTVARVWIGACITGDVLITSNMFYFLHLKARKNPKTSNKVREFGKHCLQANILALLTQIYIATTFTQPNTGFWFILGTFDICKILTFCMFSSFNARRGTAVVDSQAHPSGKAYSLPVVKSADYALPEMVTSQMSHSRRTTLSNIHVVSESRVEVDTEDHSWEPSKRTRFLRLLPVTVQLTPLATASHGLFDKSIADAYDASKEQV